MPLVEARSPGRRSNVENAPRRRPITGEPSYIRVGAVVWAYGREQTDRQTRVTTIHFASSTTHAIVFNPHD